MKCSLFFFFFFSTFHIVSISHRGALAPASLITRLMEIRVDFFNFIFFLECSVSTD